MVLFHRVICCVQHRMSFITVLLCCILLDKQDTSDNFNMSVPISNRTKRIMKLVNQVSTENVDNRMDVLHTDVFITSNLGKVIEEAEVIFENEFGGTGQKESSETVLLVDNNVRIPENFGKSANEDTNTEIIFTTTDMNVLEETSASQDGF